MRNGIKVDNYFLMKLCSFISSMFPFSLYMLLEYYGDKYRFFNVNLFTPNNAVVLLFIIEIISIIYVIYFFKLRINSNNKNNYIRVQLREVVQDKTNTSNYLLANVLPIATMELDEVYKAVFIIVLLILLGFMYIKNNLYYMNPLYDLINIKVYTCSASVLDENNVVTRKLNKTIISAVNLYEFKDNNYIAIEGNDTIIVKEKD